MVIVDLKSSNSFGIECNYEIVTFIQKYKIAYYKIYVIKGY